jgi:nucleotide-binding universal stress UspA family protein
MILACVDLTPISGDVVEVASSLARSTGTKLTLFHAARTEPVLSSGGIGPSLGHRVPPTDIGERRAKLDGWIERLRGEGLDVGGGVLLCDEPPQRFILDEAMTLGASYLVIGSQQYGRVSEALVGSVAAEILRHARIPVVVVPAHRAA